MIGENSIQSRGLLWYEGLPIKVYPFSQDFERLYRTTERAMEEVRSAIGSNPDVEQDFITKRLYLFAISFPWGYVENGEPIRMVDLFGFEFDKPWGECNPEFHPYVFRNGVYQTDGPKACETGLIILGEEGKLRRRCTSLDEFLSQWADIGSLGPLTNIYPIPELRI